MIAEHELIEQIEENKLGWPLDRCCELLESLGRPDPLTTIKQMYCAGYLAVVDSVGAEVPEWRFAKYLRDTGREAKLHVLATDAGSKWVYG